MLYSRITIMAMLGLSLAAVGCKKKSKHKGANQVVQNPKPKLDDQYGREITEGNSRIFRGTDRVFWVKANPYTITVNETVQFEGACGPSNAGQLGWDFGDQVSTAPTAPTVTGFTVSHAYTKIGSYKVVGNCTHNGASQKGTLTIEVVAASSGGNQGGFIDPGQNSPIQNQVPNSGGSTTPGGSVNPGYHPR